MRDLRTAKYGLPLRLVPWQKINSGRIMQFRRSKCFYSIQSWIWQCAAGAEFRASNAVGYRTIHHQFSRLGKAYYSWETVHAFWVRARVAGGTFLSGILLGLNMYSVGYLCWKWPLEYVVVPFINKLSQLVYNQPIYRKYSNVFNLRHSKKYSSPRDALLLKRWGLLSAVH